MGDSTFDVFGPGESPFSGLTAFGNAGLSGHGGYGRRAGAQFPALSDLEAEPLKDKLLHRTISGLHYVGSTLDKAFGARALRGLAAGKPHELLSLIPGSDTVGLTKPEDAVSMDDLLTKHYHVFKPNDPKKWEFRDFAIPALEAVADPGMWLMPFGGATRAGRIAGNLGHTAGWSRRALTEGFTHLEPELRALGHTSEQIAHMANQGHRVAPQALVDEAGRRGVTLQAGMPLRGAVGLTAGPVSLHRAVGTGPWAQGLAGTQDALAGTLARVPPVPQLRALFDPRVGRAGSAAIQASAAHSGMPAREAMQSVTRAGEYQLRTDLDRVMAPFRRPGLGGLENEALRVIRGITEDSPVFANPHTWQADLIRRHGANLATGVTDPHALAAHITANWGQLHGMGSQVRSFSDDLLRHAQDAGLRINDLSDPYAHYAARRYIAAAQGFGGSEMARQFPTLHGSNIARKQPLRDVPGATTMLDEWAVNPALSGPARTMGPAQAQAQVLRDMLNLERMRTGAVPLPTDLIPKGAGAGMTYAEKAKEVADWLQSVPAVHAQHGVPYFNPDIVGDYAMRGQRQAGVAGSAAAVSDAATKLARPAAHFLASGERSVGLGDFLTKGGKSGLTTDVRVSPGGNPEWYGSMLRAWERMAPQGFGPVDAALLRAPLPQIQGRLNEFHLSQTHADEIAKYLQGWMTPTEMKPFLGAMSGAHQLFKNAVYPLWPASHFRNLTSAVWNNTLHGSTPGDYLDALRIMRRGTVRDPARYAMTAGQTPRDAAHLLNKGAYADAKVYSGINSYEEMVGGRGPSDPRLLEGLMGQRRLAPQAPGVHPPLSELIGEHGWQNWNPLAQAGVLGQTEDKFLPLVAGRRFGSQIEDHVRLANYLGGLRQGMSSSQAGLMSRGIHFDYTDLTPFERNVMKQVVPFYTFMRKNLPYQLNMAAARPGAVSPYLHATGATNPTSPWVPEYLAANAAVPVGAEQDGQQRFVGSFGLPLEEALQRFKFKDYELPWGQTMNLPSASGTASAFIGDTSPYLKMPLEFITNYQFKSGRRLSDLHSKGLAGGYGMLPEEYAQPLTELVANSPLARIVSSTNTLIDPRKGPGIKAANLLTGMRFTDVDMDKYRNAALRSELDELLKTDPHLAQFTNFYPKQEFRGQLDGDLVERLRLFTTLKNESKLFHRTQGQPAAAGR